MPAAGTSGPHRSFHTLKGLSLWITCYLLILFFFFLTQRTVENMRLERISGGLLVQCPTQSRASFTFTSGCSRSCPAELWKSSRDTTATLATSSSAWPPLTGRTLKNLPAPSRFTVSPCLSACPCPISQHLTPSLIHMFPSDILRALSRGFAEALVPSLCTIRTPFRFHPFFQKGTSDWTTGKKCLKCPGYRVQRVLLGVRKCQFGKALQSLY